jgi:Holliday junction resolvase
LKIKKDKNQSIGHRYFVEKIKQLLEKSGWTVFKEKSDIDLVAQMDDRTVAIEVETGKNKTEQIQKNVRKLVNFAAADRFIVATNENAFLKIQNIISEFNPSASLQLYPVKEFIKNPPI